MAQKTRQTTNRMRRVRQKVLPPLCREGQEGQDEEGEAAAVQRGGPGVRQHNIRVGQRSHRVGS